MGGYGKLFESMFDGTLATKGPWQAVVTFQQFLILKDANGIVDMTPEAISRRTTIPLDIIRAGINVLEQSDPDSRRPDEEGRRIVRLSEHRTWGWRVVNHEHYRDLRAPSDRRDYMREYQRKRRAKGGSGSVVNSVNAVNSVLTGVSTSTHTDTDTDKNTTPSASKRRLGASFDRFWAAFPNKKAKKDARKSWARLAPDEALVDRILQAIDREKISDQWRRGYVPHPATWLNGERWNDEPSSGRPPAAGSAATGGLPY